MDIGQVGAWPHPGEVRVAKKTFFFGLTRNSCPKRVATGPLGSSPLLQVLYIHERSFGYPGSMKFRALIARLLDFPSHTLPLVLGVATMAVLAGSEVGAQEGGIPVRSISVTGTVETKTAPDQIVWRISLRDENPEMRVAKAANDERVKAVAALRETLGVAEGDFETGSVNIHREYERDAHGRRGAFSHFVVTRSVTLRQRDLARFDEYLDSLVSSTEMEVSFHFESSKLNEIRAAARLDALRVAKEKAAAMAEVVGAQLGRVLTIDEHPPGEGGGARANVFSNSIRTVSTPSVDLATDTFVPGAISVSVTVYTTFALQ